VGFEVGNQQLIISLPLTKYMRKVEYNWSINRFLSDIKGALIGLGGMFCVISSLNLVHTLESIWVISV